MNLLKGPCLSRCGKGKGVYGLFLGVPHGLELLFNSGKLLFQHSGPVFKVSLDGCSLGCGISEARSKALASAAAGSSAPAAAETNTAALAALADALASSGHGSLVHGAPLVHTRHNITSLWIGF